jgi:glycerol-3-phosphate dehydrogenase (NAD(P)+)
MGEERRNPLYLSDLLLPDTVRVSNDHVEVLAGAEIVVVAVPSHALREVMTLAAPHLAAGAIVVSTIKGIEFESGMLPHEVLEDVLDANHHPRITSLSGPSFAREVAEGKPTVVTIAGREESYAIAVQSTLSSANFRCYSTDDIVGVEVGGALKNIIAIAVGISDGMGLGTNARAALMTRGLAEIMRLALKLGGRLETLGGLAGMGDLLLTCTGDLSRNRRVGLGLGRGQRLEEIIEEIGEVAEGVRTTRATCRLANRLGVELPIAESVREVLDLESTPQAAAHALMTRQLGPEYALRSGAGKHR